MTISQVQLAGRDGNSVDIELSHTLYLEAADKGTTMPMLMQMKYGDKVDLSKGTVFDQCLLNSGIYMGTDNLRGLGSPTVKQMFDGLQLDMAGIRSPDGKSGNISARILFPQVILETIAENLTKDQSDFLSAYNSMVGITRNVASSKVDQPVINTKASEDVEAGDVAQLSEPTSLVSITVGDTTKRIPTKAVGLMISDEAQRASTLDLVALAMSAHARGERIRMVERDLNAMVNGDVDRGMAALTAKTAKSYDDSITAAGQITKTAWIKFLRDNYQTRNLNAVMMSLDTAIALDKALTPTDHTEDRSRIATGFGIRNLGIKDPAVLLVDDTVLSAGRIVGLDTRYAIQRMINVSAAYDAVEDFVLRRAKAFRVDHGESSFRLYDEAWNVMDLTV